METRPNASSVIKLPDNASGKDTTNLRAYLVNAAGNITHTGTFDGQTSTLPAAGEGEKVYVGPALPQELPENKASERTLQSVGAYQLGKTSAAGNVLTVPHLSDVILQPPLLKLCRIPGNVGKYFMINGVNTRKPVCHARVHICNVEKRFYRPIFTQPNFTISQQVLDEMKYKFALATEQVIRKPPLPDPAFLRRTAIAKRNLPLSSLTPRVSAPSAKAALPLLPAGIMSDIQAATVENFSDVLNRHHNLLYPYICL